MDGEVDRLVEEWVAESKGRLEELVFGWMTK